MKERRLQSHLTDGQIMDYTMCRLAPDDAKAIDLHLRCCHDCNETMLRYNEVCHAWRTEDGKKRIAALRERLRAARLVVIADPIATADQPNRAESVRAGIANHNQAKPPLFESVRDRETQRSSSQTRASEAGVDLPARFDADLRETAALLCQYSVRYDTLDQHASRHEVFASSEADVFVGQQSYFDYLDTHAQSCDAPVVLLTDPNRSASALVANWALRYRVAFPDDLLVMHFSKSTPERTEWTAVARRILAGVSQGSKGQSAQEGRGLRATCMEAVQRAATQKRLILLLDGCLEQTTCSAELVEFLTAIPRTARPIVTASKECRAVKQLTDSGWSQLHLEPLYTLAAFLGLDDHSMDGVCFPFENASLVRPNVYRLSGVDRMLLRELARRLTGEGVEYTTAALRYMLVQLVTWATLGVDGWLENNAGGVERGTVEVEEVRQWLVTIRNARRSLQCAMAYSLGDGYSFFSRAAVLSEWRKMTQQRLHDWALMMQEIRRELQEDGNVVTQETPRHRAAVVATAHGTWRIREPGGRIARRSCI